MKLSHLFRRPPFNLVTQPRNYLGEKFSKEIYSSDFALQYALAARGWTIMPWEEAAQMHNDKEFAPRVSGLAWPNVVAKIDDRPVWVSVCSFPVASQPGHPTCGPQRCCIPALLGTSGQAHL